MSSGERRRPLLTQCLAQTCFRTTTFVQLWFRVAGRRQEATAGIREGVVYVISLPAETREVASVGYISSAFIEFPSEPLP